MSLIHCYDNILRVTSMPGVRKLAALFPGVPYGFNMAGESLAGGSSSTLSNGSSLVSGSGPGSIAGSSASPTFWELLTWQTPDVRDVRGSVVWSAAPSNGVGSTAVFSVSSSAASNFWLQHRGLLAVSEVANPGGRLSHIHVTVSGLAGQVPAQRMLVQTLTGSSVLVTYIVHDGTFSGPFTIPPGLQIVTIAVQITAGTTSLTVAPSDISASVTLT